MKAITTIDRIIRPRALKGKLKRPILVIIALCITIIAKGDEISDLGKAREWCDGAMLEPIEGIWVIPADETEVLIRRSGVSEMKYDIILISSPDTRLQPGKVIGSLKKSPSKSKLEIDLFRNIERGNLGNPGKCVATFDAKEGSITIEESKVKASLRPSLLLPSFWRSIRITVDNPGKKIPAGMIKTYPDDIIRTPDYF